MWIDRTPDSETLTLAGNGRGLAGVWPPHRVDTDRDRSDRETR